MVAPGAKGEAVSDGAILLRYLLDGDIPRIPGRTQPNSDFFRESGDGSGTSVIAVCSEEHIQEALERHEDRKYWRRIDLASLPDQLAVTHDPEDDEPFHCVIKGWPAGKGARQRMEKGLVNESVWVGDPPPVP